MRMKREKLSAADRQKTSGGEGGHEANKGRSTGEVKKENINDVIPLWFMWQH